MGLSTGQIAQSLRTSLFGKDVSTYNYKEDDYDINIRFNDTYRTNLNSILQQKVMFMNNRGQKLSIPISAVEKSKGSEQTCRCGTKKFKQHRYRICWSTRGF